jgi:integrase
LAEAKRLRKKDFDLEKGFLTVPNRKGGYNKTTIAPPARPVLDIFLKRFNDNDLIFPMTRTAAWQVCKESGVIAKIKYFEIQEVREIDGLYTYLFKHAYEQRMEELGAQQTLISMKLRHSAQGKNRNQVTERYGMRWRRLMIWEKEKITEKLNLT